MPKKDPDSHRCTTMASTTGKIVEKEMMERRIKPQSKVKEDPLQCGFTEECSQSIWALMVTKAIAECNDFDQTLYTAFMDSSKVMLL